MRPGHRALRICHRWLGLGLGLLVALLGLTGSVLVFHKEIDHFALNRDLWRVEATDAPQLSLAELAERVRAQRPAGSGHGADRPSFAGSAPLGFWSETLADGTVRSMTAALDPATGAIRGAFAWGELPPTRANLTSVVYRFHYQLFAGETGLAIVGFIGIGTMLLIGIGLYLWWPAAGRWWQRLTLKRGASPVRRDSDLHNVAGAWGALLLFVVALSGTYMAFPEQVQAGLEAVMPVTEEAPLPKLQDGERLPAVDAERVARGLFPDARYDGVILGDEGGAHRFVFRQAGDPRKEYGSTRVEVDPGSGAVLRITRPADWTIGDAVMRWQFPLHNGEAFGLPGRILIFVAGLLPSLLLWTGVRLWLARRRARQRAGQAMASKREAHGTLQWHRLGQ